MEQEHAIPQQISSYQFRLVGDMTIQQFFQIAGGAVITLILYTTNLPDYIKWPLMLVSFLIGVALAFFPVEDRPLAKWIVLFFKSIYSPTLYEWQKDYQKPYYFQDDLPVALQQAQATAQAQTVQPEIAQPVQQPVGPIIPEQPVQPLDPSSHALEQTERIFLDKLDDHFSEKAQSALVPDTSAPQPTVVGQSVFVPTTEAVVVEQNAKLTSDPAPIEVQRATPSTSISPMAKTDTTGSTQVAQYSEEAAPPTPSSIPNVIVGQVISKDGAILENAILEIHDSEGHSVRALKTNKLGHFMIVTPLSNGHYQISAEKEGYTFTTQTIELTGTLVPPIFVRSN
jgi:Carboxypeptidase regulatory-like domain